MSETLYRKVGRKYVPAYDVTRAYDHDHMKVGTWRMVYAYADGGRRYEYGVTPDIASFRAAAMLAREAMISAMDAAAKSCPNLTRSEKGKPYTKQQLQIINRFRDEMVAAGAMLPEWWSVSSAPAIADAAIKAIEGWKDECF